MGRFHLRVPSVIRDAAAKLPSFWPVAVALASIAIAACNSNGGNGY